MKKKQKAFLIIGTTVFDIIVLFCLIFQNNIYEYMLDQNKLRQQNEYAINDNRAIKFNDSNIIDDTVSDVLVLAEDELVREEVYEGMTIEELSEKLDRSLNSDLKGKGTLIASYSLEKGVDPYLATAIMLHETGCEWECSYLVRQCNNVGGQKGIGCGAYSYFETLDLGIQGFIDNLYKNYVAYGLVTAEQINPKYAESTTWAANVNRYVAKIKNN